jgi:hypothetical protein
MPVGRRRLQVVFDELQEKRGFPAAGLGHRQQVAAKQARWEIDGHRVALVLGDSDSTSIARCIGRHAWWQSQPATCGGAVDQGDVVRGLREMPEPGQLTHVQESGTTTGDRR